MPLFNISLPVPSAAQPHKPAMAIQETDNNHPTAILCIAKSPPTLPRNSCHRRTRRGNAFARFGEAGIEIVERSQRCLVIPYSAHP
jgi:hypothetical protein